jgi:hypothetical protein
VKPLSVILLILLVGLDKAQCQHSSCISTSSRKVFYISGDTVQMLHQLSTDDGGQLWVGQSRKEGLVQTDGLIIKLDADASIRWAKRISSPQPGESLLLNNAIASENGYIIAGIKTASSETSDFSFCLFRYDTSGNIVWQKYYLFNNSAGPWDRITLTGLSEGGGGSIYVTGTVTGSIPWQTDAQFALLFKTDAAGNMQFGKLFYDTYVQLNTFIGVHVTGKDLVIWGYADNSQNIQTDPRRIYWMRLDTTNALPDNGEAFCFAPFSSSAIGYTFSPHLFKSFKTSNGYSIAGLLAEDAVTNRALSVLHFDDNFRLVQSWMLPSIAGVFARNSGDFSVAVDGSLLLAQRSNAIGTQTYLSRFNRDGDILTQRKLEGVGPGTGIHTADGGVRIGMSDNKIRYTSNYLHNGIPAVELLALSPHTSDTVCLGKETRYGLPQGFDTYSMPAHFNTLDVLAGSQIPAFTSTDVTIDSESKCAVQSVCNELAIRGSDTVCIFGQPTLYTVRRNASCSLPVRWQFDSAHCRDFNILSDSTILITWNITAAGRQTTELIVTTDDCQGVSDTLSVLLVPFYKPFQPDTMLCEGDSIRLSPGNWFKSYLWQDGSTDSVFVARKPGRYKVRYTGYCGHTFTDSVEIKYVNTALIQNPVEQICQGDSVTLVALSGFIDYRWTPDYYIMARAGNAVTVAPLSDTFYIVSAGTASGCRVTDTVRLEVTMPADVRIEQKAQNCAAILSAHASATLSELRWWGPMNGTGKQWTVTQSGRYTLVARDNNGCLVKDSVQVVIADCNPLVEFPNAFTPNQDGRNDMFRPVLKGRLVQYELSVFNVWGQQVFYSKDPFTGWDGTLSGKPQQQATFVWLCRYQLAGQDVVTKKGTVVLVR